jgi:hypothetical protein
LDVATKVKEESALDCQADSNGIKLMASENADDCDENDDGGTSKLKKVSVDGGRMMGESGQKQVNRS